MQTISRSFIYLNGYKISGKYLLVKSGGELVARVRIQRPAVTFFFYWRCVSLEYFSLSPSPLGKLKIVSVQLLRDFRQNGLRFVFNYFLGYRASADLSQLNGFLAFEIEGDDRVLWISRAAVNEGVRPYALNHTVEYDFSRFSKNFSALIWGVKTSGHTNSAIPVQTLDTKLSYETVKIRKPSEDLALSFQQLQDSKILHGKSVVFENSAYPTDVDNCIDSSFPSDMLVSVEDDLIIVSSADKFSNYSEPSIFFGSSTSWFHFLIEVFPRYLIYGIEKIKDKSIVIEHNVPSQILEVLSLLSSKSHIKVFPFESATFQDLVVSVESRFPSGLDLVKRSSDIKMARDFFRKNLVLNTSLSTRKIFIIRNKNLFRRSEQIEHIFDVARKYHFEFIDTGELSFREQATIFSEASHVIGETGSSLTNLLFCPDDCKVLEINLTNFMPGFFGEFCDALNLEHQSIDQISKKSNELTCRSGGIEMDLESLFL